VKYRILFLVLAAGLAAWTTVFADGPQKPATPAAGRDVQDFVFLSDARPVLVRLHIHNDGKPFQESWEDFVGYVFKWLDRNNDGALARDEAERLPSPGLLFGNPLAGFGGGGAAPKMEQLDANRDGTVSMQELGNYFRKNGGAPFEVRFSGAQPSRRMSNAPAQNKQPTAEILNQRLFNLLDTNKDGKLSREELAKAEEVLLKLDIDDDEMVTIKELVPDDDPFGFRATQALGTRIDGGKKPEDAAFVAVTPGESPTALSRSLLAHYGAKDGKGDRKLTRQQLGLDDATFQRLDVDGDGALDLEELSRFARRPPDVELTVRLGKKAAGDARVEVVQTPGRPQWVTEAVRMKDGNAVLDLGLSRFDLKAGSSGGNGLGAMYPFEQIYKAQFSMADKDGNGYIDENEAKQSPLFRETFRAMDADGDGKVTEKEMLAFFKKIEDVQAKAMLGCTSLTVADQGRGLFDLLDTNHDGRLSVREMRSAVKLIDALDRDGDGCLGKNEIPRSYTLTVQQGFMGADALNAQQAVLSMFGAGPPAAPRSTRGPRWFREMDRNGDGDVSRREFLGSAGQFKRIDTDGDGLISVEEAERYDAEVRKAKEAKK
jgi:Ca2+-binding EF-hand superfamily protein